MEVIFSEFALKELNEVYSFYELEIEGLGEKFTDEIVSSTKRISNFAEAFPIITNEVRKCVIRKFPFNLFYSIEKDFILILSVAHQHRKPFYWAQS